MLDDGDGDDEGEVESSLVRLFLTRSNTARTRFRTPKGDSKRNIKSCFGLEEDGVLVALVATTCPC